VVRRLLEVLLHPWLLIIAAFGGLWGGAWAYGMLTTTPEQRAQMRADQLHEDTVEACAAIRDYLFVSSPAPGADYDTRREREIKETFRVVKRGLNDGSSGTPHAAILRYLDDMTRRYSEEELDYLIEQAEGGLSRPSELPSAVDACEELAPDAGVGAAAAAAIENRSARFGWDEPGAP
jgi:hypothetical protein